jgi:hypothetical protein
MTNENAEFGRFDGGGVKNLQIAGRYNRPWKGVRIQCGAVRGTVFRWPRWPLSHAQSPFNMARWRVIRRINVAVWVVTATLMTSAVEKAVRVLQASIIVTRHVSKIGGPLHCYCFARGFRDRREPSPT